MTLHLPQYDSVFLERDFPKDHGGLLYRPAPLPWRRELVRDPVTNEVLSNAENLDLALTECPELSGLFWWETQIRRLFVIGKMPDDWMFAPDTCRKLSSDDLTDIQVFLQRNGLKRIDRSTVYWGIRKVAKRYHNFRREWWT